MIQFNFFKKSSRDRDPTLDIIARIKQGNNDLKDKFIDDYRPFIIKCVYQVTRKFVEIENSEEYSIGLSAFNEAIDCFDESKERKFLNFASQVIRRRLLTYKLQNKKNEMVYPFTYVEESISKLDDSLAELSHIDFFRKFELKDEINSFIQKLSEFNITMYELVKKSPKHKDAISSCITIARLITENENLYNMLMEKKTVPMTELMKHVNVSQRTVERNRKFIIAACIIIRSDLDIVKEYLKNAEKAGK